MSLPFKDEKLVFNPADFESIKADIKFKNLTSGLNEAARSPQVQLLEVLPQGLIVSVPSKRCAFGHHVDLDITVESQGKSVHFQGTAKVVTHDKEDHESDRIGVEFMQLNLNEWNNFLAVFGQRQNQIEAFFKGVKGS